MDFSFSDLNFNSVENLPGFEARAAFTVNSASVFRRTLTSFLQSWMIVSLMYRGEATIKCLSTCSRSPRKTSSQASFFGETLFPDLAITDQVKGTGSKWERYLALRPKILDIEASLAEEFFSPELMVRLRNEVLRKTHTADLARVINAIRGQVVDLLNGGSIRMRDMIDVVNHIRCNPDLFPEWHASETAKLFAPPIFKNKKEARGYFF